MSSYTEIHVAPRPRVETTVVGSKVVSTSRLFGENGCRMIRETLEDLCQEESATIRELTRHVAGDQEALQAEQQKVAALFGWRRAKEQDVFELTVQSQDLPKEVTDQGVESLEVQLRVGHATLETHFERTVVGEQRLAAAAQTELTRNLQRVVNQRVNNVLAATVRQRVEDRLRERLNQKQAVGLRARVANQCTLRMHAHASVSTLGAGS